MQYKATESLNYFLPYKSIYAIYMQQRQRLILEMAAAHIFQNIYKIIYKKDSYIKN